MHVEENERRVASTPATATAPHPCHHVLGCARGGAFERSGADLDRGIEAPVYPWISVGELHLDMSLKILE